MGTVGDEINANNASWTFDSGIADNFEDHVSKSVPFYNEGHDLVCKLSDFFIGKESICYELGSSTGLLSYKLAHKHGSEKGFFIGIDSVYDMYKYSIDKYKQKNLEFFNDDVLDFEYQKTDLFVSYYLLQFIRPAIRQNLINKVYENLNWGGAFICFEKVRACDARFQDIASTLYMDFKLDNGYNANQIIAKTRSLKGVLEPFSSQGNIDLFSRAGFKDIITIFKYINFEGFLCIK